MKLKKCGEINKTKQNKNPPLSFNMFVPVIKKKSVGFKVLTAVVIFWDITPCSPFRVDQCSRGTCHLHLQHEGGITTCWLLRNCFLFVSLLNPEVGGEMLHLNVP
jgi:hypothetical protein